MTRAVPELAQIEGHDGEVLLTPKEVGAWLRLSEETLRKMRLDGTGPVPTRLRSGRQKSVWRYKASNVQEFIDDSEGFAR